MDHAAARPRPGPRQILSPRPFQHLGVVRLARVARPSRFRRSAEFEW